MLVFACSSGDSGGGAEPLNPPPNIDAESCAGIVSADGTIPAECSSCCTERGFPGATLYDESCVCGRRRDQSGETVCATQAASDDVCASCCEGAGYTGRLFSSGTAGSTCSCFGMTDNAICAASLNESDPSSSCRTCCLNNGFIGTVYVNFGTRECSCRDP